MEALNYKDISLNILQLLRDGITYKAATQVCRLWHSICSTDLRWMIAKYFNHLWTLINKYPNKKWNWSAISYNPNTTWEIILRNPNKPWDWNWASQNPNITWEIISGNPNKLWNWYAISQNPNITWEIISENPDKPWDWLGISRNS